MNKEEQATHRAIQGIAKKKLTLRDQFATAALTGIINSGVKQFDQIAKDAYSIADAMMEYRKPSQPENFTDRLP